MTLGAYALEWLADTKRTVRPKTFAFYRDELRHAASLADVPIAALTPAHIRALIAKKTDAGLSTRTVRGIVQTLALLLRRAQEDGLTERNVAALVRLPKLEQREPQHFTAAQARRFLEVSRGDDLFALYATALGTGLRRGELLALTPGDVSLGEAWVRVRRGKTDGSARTVPLPDFARSAIAAMERSPGPLWPYRPEYVSRRFKELCAEAGVPVIRFHDLRHTTATLMAEAGVSDEVRQWLLGHAKVSMTRHYSHESEALKRAAVERLGKVVNG